MDISVIVPARNEEMLNRTVEDLLEHIEADTEIIVVLEEYFPDPPLKADPRVRIIYNPVAKGQRAAANQAAKIANGKYIIKVDAHCAFDQGFDRKMLEFYKELDNPKLLNKFGIKSSSQVTAVPIMRNLHAFDWVCPDGHRRYQGRAGVCRVCGKPTTKDIVWIAKTNPSSKAYRFDKTMHFQYWGELAKRQTGDITETMSLQGSFFMITKEKYFELDICSETDFYSWGQQGVEVACKTWLSGGAVLCNQKTWYAHMFRVGDFDGFPYHNPQSLVNENREKSRELFQHDGWPKATRKFQWILDHFNPPEWSVTKGMIYYTTNTLDEKIAKPVRDRLEKIGREKNIKITTSSLKKMDFGDNHVRFPSLKPHYLTMFKQIVGALEKSSDDIIFFTEHDVLYHPSHFEFTPLDKETFYYNTNVWFLRATDGHCLHYDVNQLSGLCVYRDTALVHFRERYEMAKTEYEKMQKLFKGDELERNFNRFIRHMGFEPFTHGRVKWQNQFKQSTWKSELPNIDIKHGANATGQRWKKEQYRNQQLLINWTESEDWNIEGWDKNLLKTLQ